MHVLLAPLELHGTVLSAQVLQDVPTDTSLIQFLVNVSPLLLPAVPMLPGTVLPASAAQDTA